MLLEKKILSSIYLEEIDVYSLSEFSKSSYVFTIGIKFFLNDLMKLCLKTYLVLYLVGVCIDFFKTSVCWVESRKKVQPLETLPTQFLIADILHASIIDRFYKWYIKAVRIKLIEFYCV